jgi:hypothetical protein
VERLRVDVVAEQHCDLDALHVIDLNFQSTQASISLHKSVH